MRIRVIIQRSHWYALRGGVVDIVNLKRSVLKTVRRYRILLPSAVDVYNNSRMVILMGVSVHPRSPCI